MKRSLFFLIIFVLFLSCIKEEWNRSVAIGFMGGLITLDPHMRSETVTVTINSNIFESLVVFDKNMSILPSLAISWENPDTKTWIFHLKENVLFSNDDTLSAEDVQFSILRARNHPSSELKGNLLQVKNIDIINRNTILITTTTTDFVLLNKLVSVPIVSKKYMEGHNLEYLSCHPVGTGPYRFLEWKKDKYVKVVRNDNYWGEKPQVEKATFMFYTDLDKAVEDLLNGRIDILDNFPCDEIKRIEDSKDVELVYTPGLSTRYIGFNMASPIFKNKKIRMAIFYALNRRRLIDSVRMGYADEATQLLNPKVYGYNPIISLVPYDTATAEKLLKEEGYAEGLRMKLGFFEARKKLGKQIKEDLSKVNIDVVLAPTPAGKLFKEAEKGNFDAYIASWISTSGDAGQVLYEKIHSRDRERGYGLLNHERFSNEKIDALIESLENLETPNERLKMMQMIMTCVMDEVPSIPLYVSEDLYAKRKNIAWQPRLDRIIYISEIKDGR